MVIPSSHIALLVLLALLLLLTGVRWIRTPEPHPDYAARRDTLLLAALLLTGQSIMLLRERFATLPAVFWLCSGLLVPVLTAILTVLWRLVQSYRKSAGI